MMTIARTSASGAREVFDQARYLQREAARGRTDAGRYLTTCGHCRRTWDDGTATSVTPAPAADPAADAASAPISADLPPAAVPAAPTPAPAAPAAPAGDSDPSPLPRGMVEILKGGAPVASLYGDGAPDPRNSAPLPDLAGFRPGDRVMVNGRTIGPSRVEIVFRRALAGFDPVACARVVDDGGKRLDVLTSELVLLSRPAAPPGPVPAQSAAPPPPGGMMESGATIAPDTKTDNEGANHGVEALEMAAAMVGRPGHAARAARFGHRMGLRRRRAGDGRQPGRAGGPASEARAAQRAGDAAPHGARSGASLARRGGRRAEIPGRLTGQARPPGRSASSRRGAAGPPARRGHPLPMAGHRGGAPPPRRIGEPRAAAPRTIVQA